MSDYIINESRFVIDISDELKDDSLSGGAVLPDLSVVGDKIDRAGCFQIYDTADGAYNLLAVNRRLAARWIAEGYLKKEAFLDYVNEEGEELAIMYSPSSLILQRVTETRAYGSLRCALSFAAAMFKSRSLDPEVNLRDGIFCELYSVILPCYTKSRAVADRALFANVLSRDHREDISSKEELGDKHGLNRLSLREELSKAGLKLPAAEPYLKNGELVDDFVLNGGGLTVSSAVVLDENFQVYAASGDSLILLMENAYASTLIEKGLLSQLDLGAVSFGGLYLKALSFSNHYALEKVNDRHFGLTQEGAFRFALAVKRTRALCPSARLSDALYSEELGLLLPISFDGADCDDADLVREVVTVGPFANAPFLDDVIEAAAMIAS